MVWKAEECYLAWPTTLHAKIARAQKPDREDVLDFASKMMLIHSEAIKLARENGTLKIELARAKQENMFLTNLIQANEYGLI